MDLSATILASIVKAGLRRGLSFPELCMDSKGATPIAVRAALRRFDERATLKERAAQLLGTVGDAHEWRPELDTRLPVPHPLDFDWRFSASTAKALAVKALAKAGHRSAILLVGVPSVLLAIGEHPTDPSSGSLRAATTP